jgi:hypothetical protein
MRNIPGAEWLTFCRHGTIFIEHYACRGTSLIGAANLSPVTKLLAGTGAVSRYKLSRSQKFITVQDFNCGQMCVSGRNNHYKFVLGAGAKAKTVTSPLIIPSVLGFRYYFKLFVFSFNVIRIIPFSPALPYSFVADIPFRTFID